jgi:7-cyano-7-deazaguanine tRNA-ribosyltransferase
MIFPGGTQKLDDIYELPCSCPICTSYTVSELRKMKDEEMILQLAKHNLYVSFAEIKKIRNAIAEGTLWELVERKAASNPYLQEALMELRKKENKKWLEQYEPTSKKRALFYTGNHTIHRPIIYRYHERLFDRYKPLPDTTIIFPEGNKPYSKYYSKNVNEVFSKNYANIIVNSHLGPVPIELDEMYPFAQSIFPEITDKETNELSKKIFNEFTKNKKLIFWKNEKTILKLNEPKNKPQNFDIRRISAVANMQFGKNASKSLFKDDLKIVKSKKTKKIRNIYADGKHLLSMRAEDGMFTLKIQGGKLLHKHFKYPKLRIVIQDDAVPFVKDGKSVFAKFVIDSDQDLRPLDECLIVDKKDTFLAVGRTILNRQEMLSFSSGVAVKTRESVSK